MADQLEDAIGDSNLVLEGTKYSATDVRNGKRSVKVKTGIRYSRVSDVKNYVNFEKNIL